jgi:hypothetical protein
MYNNVATNYERAVIADHVEVTVTHAVALVERIRCWPGRRDTFVAVCYIGIKLK